MASFSKIATALALATLSLPLVSAQFPKRGLAFNNPSNYIQNWNGGGSQVNWAYNWDSYMDDGFPQFMEFIPMLWGTGGDHTGNWFNNANAALSRGSGHLLAFNEPDACGNGQSCISPWDAANAYMQYMMPFADRASLGAPSVTNGAGGLDWLRQFIDICNGMGCRIDFVPVHWYDAAWNTGYFYDYMNQAHDAAGGRQIWLTEFNGSGSEGDQINFLQQVMPWMDNTDWIFRYAWFSCLPDSNTPGSLVDWNGNPTNIGGVYAYTGY